MEIGTSLSPSLTGTNSINSQAKINITSVKSQFTLNKTSKSNDVLGYYHNLCKDFQKGRAYIHWAQTDVELQVYKSKSEAGEYTYRVDTSKNGELVNSQIIDPKSVDPRSATSEELIALDEYLCDTNQLTNNVCIRGTSMMSGYSSAKYNAYELGQSAMETQLNFLNIPSYLDYKSIIEILESLYS